MQGASAKDSAGVPRMGGTREERKCAASMDGEIEKLQERVSCRNVLFNLMCAADTRSTASAHA
jgi:hypothetical protein